MKCPSCKNKVIMEEGQPKCNFCGAFARINSTNATLEWVKDDRVFLNEEMAREAWEEWKKVYPDSFEEAEKQGQKP